MSYDYVTWISSYMKKKKQNISRIIDFNCVTIMSDAKINIFGIIKLRWFIQKIQEHEYSYV